MKKSQDIIHVSAYYPPHLGGMENVVENIATELARRDYKVQVFTSDVGMNKNVSNDYRTNLEIHRLKSFEIAHTPIIWLLPFRLLFLRTKSIIHLHISQAGIAEISWIIAKLRRFPFVSHFHLDIGPSGSMGILLPIYKKYFLGYVLRNSDKVITFSEQQKQLLIEKYNIQDNKIEIIPNGVANIFSGKEISHNTETPLKLLSVSRLDIQKKIDRLIQAISYMKTSVELTIIGEGEQEKMLKYHAKELNLKNILFVGRKNSEELYKYYEESDIFLTSSDREGMSLVALEAMAMGLPIIGSNVIGTKELIKDVGILVEEPYPENFASAIDSLIDHPEELKKLSEQSTQKAKEYTWYKLVDKLESVYKEISK